VPQVRKVYKFSLHTEVGRNVRKIDDLYGVYVHACAYNMFSLSIISVCRYTSEAFSDAQRNFYMVIH